MSAPQPGAGLSVLIRPSRVEAALWRRLRYEDDAQCRETLFTLYRHLARSVAHSEFRRRPTGGLERRDFEHWAYGGLLEAIDHFDPRRGAPFEAYARARLRGAIANGAARSSESSAQYAFFTRVARDRIRALEVDGGEDPSDPIGQLADMASALAIGYIAEGAGDADSATLASSAYDEVSWRDLQLSVQRAIERLPSQEESVMRQHYFHGVPFAQIAQMLSLSKGRVSQLHRQALSRIRDEVRRCQ